MNKPMSPAARALYSARHKMAMQSEETNRSIKFDHRRPDMAKDYVRKDFAEFDLFKTLCIAQDVDVFIDNVFFDSKIQAFEINTRGNINQFPDSKKVIMQCASDSLSQFIFNDINYYKRGR